MTIVQDSTNKSGAQKSGSEPQDGTLAELRKSVTEISKELATIVEQRSQAARETAEAGVASVRKGIRQQPVIAMGIATLAGAAVALLVVPRSALHRRPASRGRYDAWMPNAWMPNNWMPNVTRADLQDFAENVQRSVVRAAHSVPVTSSFERVADALSKVEPGSSLSTLVDKIGTWVQQRVPDAVKPAAKK
jgi:ElaB/YqjD/DUF883 family membrane-anchored ribosome-binding protein